MKLVGEAIKKSFHVQKKEEVKLLGIAYWNLLKDKDILKKAQENPVKKIFLILKKITYKLFFEKGLPYDFDEFDNKVETYLDKNHSHFFLIKDINEEKKFGGEIDFRADFEISLGTKENRKSNI
jgi:hypothetical protein